MESKTIAELQAIIRAAGANPDAANTKEELIQMALSATAGTPAACGGAPAAGGGGGGYAPPVITAGVYPTIPVGEREERERG